MGRWFGCSITPGQEETEHDDMDCTLSARSDDKEPCQGTQNGPHGAHGHGNAAMRPLQPVHTGTPAGTFDELPGWSMVKEGERSMQRLLDEHLDRSIPPLSPSLVALTLPPFDVCVYCGSSTSGPSCTLACVRVPLVARCCPGLFDFGVLAAPWVSHWCSSFVAHLLCPCGYGHVLIQGKSTWMRTSVARDRPHVQK